MMILPLSKQLSLAGNIKCLTVHMLFSLNMFLELIYHSEVKYRLHGMIVEIVERFIVFKYIAKGNRNDD